MKKVNVFVTLRESVIDPQGTAAISALQAKGYNEVQDVRIGKYIELTLGDTERDLDTAVKEMCEKLLVNSNVEDYRFEVLEVEEA
ncbi:phosphoribosylformylglycinamidine synthase subunit PurS [Bhargavaea cecembensis]|uniref:phosphoribosylformylglycinamidine synthase subunit PurS n=1 Tax=Bhargavaea cecembensis TaxID=394098 RepID=UPI00058F55A8|nr:phosphoribosylformylglycinamidine synthase subunit PurS [Bhargavaea cecembensis]